MVGLLHAKPGHSENTLCGVDGWTNLISTSRAVQDQGYDQFAFGLAVTRDVASVCLYIRDENSGLLEECISADTACIGGRDVDELTCGFTTEWGQ